MKASLLILSNTRIIGLALLMLTAVTASTENDDKIIKLIRIQPGSRFAAVVDQGNIAVRTPGGSPHRGDLGGDAEFSRPLVDTPSMAD